MSMNKVRVAVNGYGVIGKRVADAISLQDDMELSGICDLTSDWRIKKAIEKGYPIFAPDEENKNKMKDAGISVNGTLKDLIKSSEIIIDCTPKNIAANNVIEYRNSNKKFILQGGEKHSVTNHSFSAENNYTSAIVTSPRSPSSIMRIFSSDEYFFLVLRWMFFTIP